MSFGIGGKGDRIETHGQTDLPEIYTNTFLH